MRLNHLIEDASVKPPKFIRDPSEDPERTYKILKITKCNPFYIAIITRTPEWSKLHGIIAFPIIEGIGGREMVQWDSGYCFGWTLSYNNVVARFNRLSQDGFSEEIANLMMETMGPIEPIY